MPAQLQKLQTEHGEFTQIEARLKTCQAALQSTLEQYHENASALSKLRQRAAKTLTEQVTQALRPLGMPHAVFEVQVGSNPILSSRGYDQVTYLVSANRGQPPQPLTQVASGGELSRISLAIQVEAARYAKIPTLVFDEVDVGIGGGVAEVVGKLIRTLGQSRQVICITHLPQVACQGHNHLQVSKNADNTSTRTRIQTLDSKQRIQEIARMLGGIALTEQTLSHAEEMLNLVR